MLIVCPDTYFFPFSQENSYDNTDEFRDIDFDTFVDSMDVNNNYYGKLLDEIDEEFIKEATSK